MDIRRITEDYAVSPQISPDDIPEIKAAGFRSIMCNRPDGEDYGQPEFDAVAEAARAEGIEVRCVPIVSGYCRSGTRCTMLWSIASYGRLSGDEIVSAARDAGYDMSGLVRQLDRG